MNRVDLNFKIHPLLRHEFHVEAARMGITNTELFKTAFECYKVCSSLKVKLSECIQSKAPAD